jgi:hypothetical protein
MLSLHPLTGRLRAKMDQIDQDDREHVSACESEARRDEDGLQSGRDCEKF